MKSKGSKSRGKRSGTLAASGAVLAMLGAGVTTGCDVQQAVDCARLALEVSSGTVALEQAIQNNDPAAFDEAAENMTRDINELESEVGDTDVNAAAGSVTEAVENIRTGFESGTTVDLSPLGDATSELTNACGG